MAQKTPDILKRIVARKREEIDESMSRVSTERMIELTKFADNTRGFYNALAKKANNRQSAVIAEIKKASPSKGLLCKNFNRVEIAKSYEIGGASCLSVLTDRDFFQGDPQNLIKARATVTIPVIRKDFIIHPYQVYESRAMGADCILLIVSCLKDEYLKSLSDLAISLSMDVLVEAHDLSELKRALKLDLPMIGINNRDLKRFVTDIETTIGLLKDIPNDRLVVTESGIHTPEDVARLRDHDVHAFLVGEAFMRAADPGVRLRELFF